MSILKFGCLQNCGAVLEFCSLWKCSRGFVALTGTHDHYGRNIIGTKAPASSTQSQCRLGKLRLPPNGMGMRSPLRFRKVAFIRKGVSLEEVACFEERLFVQGETCYSAFSLSSNCSSEVGNQREQVTAGSVQTMQKPEEGNRVDNAQDLFLTEVEQALGSPLGMQPQAPSRKPLVIVISGPSGVGKDTVINRLQEVRREIHFVVTATTRAKRAGEVDGKDYFFLTKEQFKSMIQKNELLEYAIVYGDYKGIPKGQVRECLAKGFDVVLRVDVQGAATVRSILGSSAVFIFLVAESEAALVRRLIKRKTETTDKLLLRIATAREEVKRMNEFDYVVVNAERHLEKSVSLICCIIDSEKARVQQREAHL